MRALICTAGLLALGTEPLCAGQVVFLDQTSPAAATVRVFDELTGQELPAPAALQGIQLLPLDFTGRTQLEEFLPQRPRLRLDTPASRLALPAQKGSLYKYTRAAANGSAGYGYFRISSQGQVIPLLELFSSTGDPFVERIAVSPSGSHALVATRTTHDGDLYELDLLQGQSFLRSGNTPPQDFGSAGLSVGAQALFAVSTSAIWRAPLGGVGEVSSVTLPLSNVSYYSRQLVRSRNGLYFLTSAGESLTQQHVFALGSSGAPIQVSTQAAQVSLAGFAPEIVNGPYLAISEEGTQAAWRIETATGSEMVLANIEQPGAPLTDVITSNANFIDTLDEIGLAIFRIGGAFHVAVGDAQAGPNPAPTLDALDLFQVSLQPGAGPSFINLSMFSGDAQAPFTAVPQVKPEVVHLLPDGVSMLLHDSSPAEGVVYLVRPGQAPQVVLQHVKSVDHTEIAGRWMTMEIRRTDGSKPQELYRFPANLSQLPTLLTSAPTGTLYSDYAPRRDGWLAFVTDPGNQSPTLLHRVHLPSGTISEWNTQDMSFGPAVGITSMGSYVLSTDQPQAAATWPLNPNLTPAQLNTGGAVGTILPGL